MRQLSEHRARSRIGRASGTAAAALLCVIALSQPNLAHAGPHGGGGGFQGGGGFHGGGFHGGGFHGGGFHGGGFHGGGFHGGGFGGFHGHGFHGGGFHPGFGGFYYPYYGYYDYGQPPSSQTWYYCSDPAGYYPYVTQCNTSWQTVPAS
jgi:uncharacterized membrane protein